MFQRVSKTIALVLCALIALPATAGERAGHHRGVTHWASNAKWANSLRWANSVKPWFGGHRRHHGRGHNRYVRLKHFSPSSSSYRIGRASRSPQPLRYEYNGTYAGSYAYETQGGTYFGADGYAQYGAPQVELLAPGPKVIDVAVEADPCSYEAKVCVIRP
ncbi:hypothetical protein AM571_CH03859 [Rhizobium etli 8C-3]|uniref:Uncharacterized protein n=2 Tax=Rhizobium TaxID=379 RepID=A0A4R3QS12_9HYPH|nr:MULTISPECIES: hypothetical protein [Rhizobium]APO76641.1 hypothetical protein AM571_CH03859 [Rhizobium etli 8C-3]TCU23959.1 hypothetical protein EV130_107319 [Rhizobium azibense]TCU36227.1 hypothetical protein EV129_108319 [Rhizobium azibense]